MEDEQKPLRAEMKAIVVDANVIFAALRTMNQRLRHTLYFADAEFYAPKFLIVEIFEHKERILRGTKAKPAEVYEYLDDVLQRIHFVSNEVISLANYAEAYRLCKDEDENDTPFIALTLELSARFWSRDEALKRHLRKMGFERFFEP